MSATEQAPRLRVDAYMSPAVECIEANATALDLQRLLRKHHVSGCPVVEGDRVVGVVSKSDLTRHLLVAQSRAEEVSDYYRDPATPAEAVVDDIGAMSGGLMQSVRVRDLMSQKLICVDPECSIKQAAQKLLEHRVHRLPVLHKGRLVGVLSSQDVVRAVAEAPEP